ncbi:hypothetical protein ACFO5Q_07835 [Kordiimonas lipolytica]|uniref:Uncharacterized protein n=1 Tax=Kordiimonas lipolytica TaxID=1662421 RepID=A0ABV8UAC2_9PROT|nr:hypothetical protein [Kordiimonas lipolytica]
MSMRSQHHLKREHRRSRRLAREASVLKRTAQSVHIQLFAAAA